MTPTELTTAAILTVIIIGPLITFLLYLIYQFVKAQAEDEELGGIDEDDEGGV